MKYSYALIAILLILAGCSSSAQQIEMEMYKTSTCGCCGIWGTYADQNGYDITTSEYESIDHIKEEYGIPQNMQSCHTSIVQGYVVEGHVPAQAIDKLLTEEPDIKGIALPGMPSGTPGMPGPKTQDWVIYALHHDGSTSEFMRI